MRGYLMLGGPYIKRILLFRVLFWGPLFSEMRPKAESPVDAAAQESIERPRITRTGKQSSLRTS